MSYLAEVLSWTFGAGTVLFSLNFVLSPLEGVANPEVQPQTRNGYGAVSRPPASECFVARV